MRSEVNIIVCELSSGLSVHFCGHSLLSGANNNLWFPMPANKSLFESVEDIMVDNNVAHNVVKIEKLVVNGKSVDYKVTFNNFVG